MHEHFHWLLTMTFKGHTDGIKSTSGHVSRLVFLFSCPPKSFKNPTFSVCVYCICIDNRR